MCIRDSPKKCPKMGFQSGKFWTPSFPTCMTPKQVNQPTFNSCKSSWPHITFATNDQHSSSSCFWTFAQHGVKHNDFCCFKGVTYVALALRYKLRSFLHWFFKFKVSRGLENSITGMLPTIHMRLTGKLPGAHNKPSVNTLKPLVVCGVAALVRLPVRLQPRHDISFSVV